VTDLDFHGGVDEIGGNIVHIETGNSSILIDFGMSFTERAEYFSEFLNPRSGHALADLLELGMLPELDGIYRKDHLHHCEMDPQEEAGVDAVFLSHGHMDHVGYVHFLREDIPLYCTPTTEALMEVVQDTGNRDFSELVEKKRVFHLREKSRGDGLTRLSGRDTDKDYVDTEPVARRDVRTLQDGETVQVKDIEVELAEVNHSLPGSAGFLVETPDTSIAYTGDLRLHGYHSTKTESFIHRAKKQEQLITEGTNVGKEDPPSERQVREKLENHLEGETDAAFVNFPKFDLERMRSVLIAAETRERTLVLRPQQAYLLEKLEDRGLLPFEELSTSRDTIQAMIPQRGWAANMLPVKTPEGDWKHLSNVDTSEEDKKSLARRDYDKWQRKIIEKDHSYTPDELRTRLDGLLVYADYYRLKDLIDLQPEKGVYLWSRTEPFNTSLELDKNRVENWLQHYNLKEKTAHASGHISQTELQNMIQTIQPDKLHGIHTQNPEWFSGF
jgi:ribonuclease J